MEKTKTDINKIEESITSLFPDAKLKSTKERMTIELGPTKWIIDLDELNKILENVYKKGNEGETIIYDKNSYETILKFESSSLFFPVIIEVKDPENKINYNIGHPSKEYLLFGLENFTNKPIFKEFSFLIKARLRQVLRKFSDEYGQSKDKNKAGNFLDLFIETSFPSRYTLRIQSESEKDIKEFEDLADSFIFNVSYNLGVAIVRVKLLDEYFSIKRSHKMERNDIEEIEPPRRTYIPGLVQRYQMGLATDNPMLQFISFYQILEYFFESIYEEELIKQIRDKITSPGFSYKKDTSLKELIKTVKKTMLPRGETVTYSEKEALSLTLKKYINVETLKEELNKDDKTLIDYYKNNEVPFSKGDTIDWDNQNTDSILKNITNRIYKNRNSIVHGKESGKSGYTPFKDDKSLSKEIPLIKSIAEEVIIESSELL